MISFIKKGSHFPTLWSKVKGFGFTTKNNFRRRGEKENFQCTDRL